MALIMRGAGEGEDEVDIHLAEIILSKRTKYQEIMIARTKSFGRTLFLDDLVQSGGFREEGGFFHVTALRFLLHEAVRTGDGELLALLERTLDAMAAGAVRDQLGGLFHRYTVDRGWRVPHFEVMLADNAQLARLYVEAMQATGN